MTEKIRTVIVRPGYHHPSDYPREAFVQAAIERYFQALGCVGHETAGSADLACDCLSGETWIIEAKGETTQVGLDFRTGLGQLLQGMHDASAKYALAVPGTNAFLRQMERLPKRIVDGLSLHFLVVDESGDVKVLESGSK